MTQPNMRHIAIILQTLSQTKDALSTEQIKTKNIDGHPFINNTLSPFINNSERAALIRLLHHNRLIEGGYRTHPSNTHTVRLETINSMKAQKKWRYTITTTGKEYLHAYKNYLSHQQHYRTACDELDRLHNRFTTDPETAKKLHWKPKPDQID
jgi:hypothetical protein